MKRKKNMSKCYFIMQKTIQKYFVCKYISVGLIKQLFAAKTTVATLIYFCTYSTILVNINIDINYKRVLITSIY